LKGLGTVGGNGLGGCGIRIIRYRDRTTQGTTQGTDENPIGHATGSASRAVREGPRSRYRPPLKYMDAKAQGVARSSQGLRDTQEANVGCTGVATPTAATPKRYRHAEAGTSLNRIRGALNRESSNARTTCGPSVPGVVRPPLTMRRSFVGECGSNGVSLRVKGPMRNPMGFVLRIRSNAQNQVHRQPIE
jgi:hypothetical protein